MLQEVKFEQTQILGQNLGQIVACLFYYSII